MSVSTSLDPLEQHLNSATTVQKQKARKRKSRKSMAQRIADAVQRSEILAKARTREVILLPTGQLCIDFPWRAQSAQPWPANCSRILVPLPQPNRKGHRAMTMIVRNEKLKFGGNGKAS